MTKAQPKLRESESARGKRNPFALIREGEPLPGIAQQALRKPPKMRTRTRRAPHTEAEQCPLCAGTITRFDGEIYAVHGRCSPCHAALEEK